MGVSGSGKSTIGQAIGDRIGVAYLDGDSYHSQANIDKMASGTPLDDDDRRSWLASLAGLIAEQREQNQSLLLGCSALKRKYRTQLRAGDPNLLFLFLDGSYDLILGRMQARDHFFSPDMLRTQFDTLERPDDHEAVCVNIDAPFDRVIDDCITGLCARARGTDRER